MPNDYFNHSANIIASGIRALAAQVNNIATEISTGLDKLPTEIQLKRGLTRFAVDTGAADAYVVDLPYVPALVDGLEVSFRPINSSTGASTVNVNSLGAKAIVLFDLTALTVGSIVANSMVTLRYSAPGDHYVLMTGASSILQIGNADTLDGLDSTQFLRSDVNDTMAGDLLVTGTFTSIGIDDNATSERFQLADSGVRFGTAGGDFHISHSATDQVLTINGGAGGNNGGNIYLYGSTHASAADDFIIRSGTNNVIQWDESVGALTLATGVGAKTLALTINASQNAIFAGHAILADDKQVYWGAGSTAIFGNAATDLFTIATNNTTAMTINTAQTAVFSGAITVQGAFTSIGIDDNATGERFEISDILTQFGTLSASYAIAHADDDQYLDIAGGNTVGVGGHVRYYGQNHGVFPGDLWMGSSGNFFLQWDESAGALLLNTGVGSKTTALTINSAQRADFAESISLDDNKFLYMGTGDDSRIYHSGGNAFWDNNLGNSYMESAGAVHLRTNGGTDALVLNTSQNATFYGYSLLARNTRSGNVVDLQNSNLSNTADSRSRVISSVAGSSAGDPTFLLNITAVAQWHMGIDNSDGDAFVIGRGGAPGTNNSLKIDTSDIATFSGGVIINEDATGYALDITQAWTSGTGNGVRANLTSANNNANVFTAVTAGTGAGFQTSVSNLAGRGFYAYSNTAFRTVALVEIDNDNATGSGIGLRLKSDAGVALDITNGGINEPADPYTVTAGTKSIEVRHATAFYPSGAMTAVAVDFTFDNPAPSGQHCYFILELNNMTANTDGTPWPTSVDWAGGTEPTWTAGIDIVRFWTRDGGTTWHGSVMSLDSQ